jgi:hypothetical protein
VRLSWRRAAEIAVLAVGAAWIVSAVVLTGVWLGIDAVSGGTAIGYAFLAIVLGFPVSVAVYVLGGALIVRAVAARRGVVLALGRSMLLQTLIGIAAFVLGGLVAAAVADTDPGFAAADAVATLLLAVPLVRWLAKPMAVASQPEDVWLNEE